MNIRIRFGVNILLSYWKQGSIWYQLEPTGDVEHTAIGSGADFTSSDIIVRNPNTPGSIGMLWANMRVFTLADT